MAGQEIANQRMANFYLEKVHSYQMGKEDLGAEDFGQITQALRMLERGEVQPPEGTDAAKLLTALLVVAKPDSSQL